MSRIVGLTLTNINSLEFYNFDFDVNQYSKYCERVVESTELSH